MIEVKQAIQIAQDYIKELYHTDEVRDLSLEEVEIAEDNKFWLVTLAFTKQMMQPLNPMEAMTGPKFARFYKELKIDTESGQVRSMKNKKL
jgi:hypothetical protein